jgi:hypothetical protein
MSWKFGGCQSDYFFLPLCFGRCERADPAADLSFVLSPLPLKTLLAAFPAFFCVVMNRSLRKMRLPKPVKMYPSQRYYR